MTVVSFTPRMEGEPGGWTAEERHQLEALHAARAKCGEVSEGVVATTESGDPQFFLIGPAPACDCVLSISRVSGRYLIEDGNGASIAEASSLDELAHIASQVRLRRSKTTILARVALVWCALRQFVEEKMEPVVGEMAEAAEVLTHFVPQAAMLA
jgi:hypothetical protein